MTYKVVFGGSNKVQSWTAADVSWSVGISAVETLVEGESAGEITVDDAIYQQYTSATIRNEGSVVVENQLPGVYSFTNLDPTIATLGQDGSFTWVSDGTARILVQGPRGKKRIEVEVSETGGEAADQFDRFATSSLAAHCAAQIEDKLPGELELFSTFNLDTNTFVRNVDCWAEGIDLTAFVVRTSAPSWWRPGTLITPRHVIQVGHHVYGVGNVITFVDTENVIHQRTVTSVDNLLFGNEFVDPEDQFDFAISTLDSDLPAGITPAKLAPADMLDYLPSVTDGGFAPTYAGTGTPIIYSNRYKRIYTGDFYHVADTSPVRSTISRNPIHTVGTNPRVGYQSVPESGDSGNSGCLVVNNELVAITCYMGGGGFSGPAVHETLDLITEICDPYTPEIADFSTFTSFA